MLKVDIEKKLNGFTLQVSFETENTTLALLGASGSGKSMTLRCIAGVETPDRGVISLNGRTLFDSEKKINLPPQKRRVGLLFQNYALFPNMTAEQNILCGLRADRSLSGQEKLARCRSMVARMHLEGQENKKPGQLSGGQQQRTALARILISNPEILLLDEPFSALDSYLKDDLEREITEQLRDFAGPVLMVTHNRDEAYRMCRQVAVVASGSVVRFGETREVFYDPRTREAARLTGCKNILPCVPVPGKGLRIEGFEAVLRLPRDADGCTAVGIRAHDIESTAEGGENTLPVEPAAVAEDPFDWNLAYRLPGTEITLLQKVRKTNLRQECPGPAAFVRLPPECLMPLR